MRGPGGTSTRRIRLHIFENTLHSRPHRQSYVLIAHSYPLCPHSPPSLPVRFPPPFLADHHDNLAAGRIGGGESALPRLE